MPISTMYILVHDWHSFLNINVEQDKTKFPTELLFSIQSMKCFVRKCLTYTPQ